MLKYYGTSIILSKRNLKPNDKLRARAPFYRGCTFIKERESSHFVIRLKIPL